VLFFGIFLLFFGIFLLFFGLFSVALLPRKRLIVLFFERLVVLFFGLFCYFSVFFHANAPHGSSDVRLFLEMDPLNSASFAIL